MCYLYKMNVHGFLTIVVFLSLEATGHANNISSIEHKTLPATNTDLVKIELDILEQEIAKLRSESEVLANQTEDVTNACDKELARLNQEEEALKNNTEEIYKRIVDIMKQIYEEEAIQIKLNEEIMELTELLDIYELQYDIIFHDIKLLEEARSNGTSNRCSDVTEKLAIGSGNTILTRSHISNKLKLRIPSVDQNTVDKILLVNKLRMDKLLKSKLYELVEEAKKAYKIALDKCEAKKRNINHLIAETKEALETSKKSEEYLEKDLKESKAFSDVLRVEINTVKGFIVQLGERISRLRKENNDYKSDIVCYQKFEAME